MESDAAKDEIIQKVRMSLMKRMEPEQIRMVTSALSIALSKYTVTKNETALSTEVIAPNDEYLKSFIAIKTINGCSKKTIAYYQQVLQIFFQTIKAPLKEISSNDVRMYLATRELQNGVTKTTLDNERRVLSSFFNTALSEEWVSKNPMLKIDKIKTVKKTLQPFTERDLEEIRRAARKSRQGQRLKYQMIVEVLYSTGCRVSEFVNIKIADIEDDRIKVLGKGNKERYVYLTPRATAAIEDYLESRTDGNPYLCPKEENLPGGHTVAPDGHTATSSVESCIRALGKRAGVEDCHPHRFRRTAATDALRHGMPINQVSKMLGHEQISTTQIYAVTEESEVRAAHRKYMR